jgi:hypothetical protein
VGTKAGERAKTRGAVREVPQRRPEFEHLSLEALRSHRQALTAEETRVSYWRRLIQARMDLIGLATPDAGVRLARLQLALSESRVGPGRQAMVEVGPVDDAPPLPDLAALWARQPHPEDEDDVAELRKDLAFAELQLSAYRAALHRRLTQSTGELIARYREQPTLCLSALPLPPEERSPQV